MSKIPGTQANKEAKMEQGSGSGMGQQGYGQGNRTCSVFLPVYTFIPSWSPLSAQSVILHRL